MANPFAQSFPKFADLAWAKNQKCNPENDKKFRDSKLTKHFYLRRELTYHHFPYLNYTLKFPAWDWHKRWVSAALIPG